MPTYLLTRRLWPAITRAAKASRSTALVAVPYFSTQGPRLLPLLQGSRLVVNASESAVKSGQTSPAALLQLHRKGVRIYSNAYLHAKVYVFRTRAFIGSANASATSADILQEAAIETSDRRAVADARRFVRSMCQLELGPEEIRRLAKLYRAPRGPKLPKHKRITDQPPSPRSWIAQVDEAETPDEAQREEARSLKAAKARRSTPRHDVEKVHYSRNHPYRVGDIYLQVFRESNGRMFVYPPGRVIHLRTWRGSGRQLHFVFVETPATNPARIEQITKMLGRGGKTWLDKNSRIRGRDRDRLDQILKFFDRRR